MKKSCKKNSSNQSVNPERFHVDLYTAPLKSVGNDPNLCENMIFDLFVAPEPRKMGGAPGAPPRPWQGLSDVALRRVKI